MNNNLPSNFNELYQLFCLNLAKQCLAFFGNEEPSSKQLLEFQDLLSQLYLQPLRPINKCLTEKEKTTLRLSAEGQSIKLIARAFNISTRQVERYRSSILKKLGCKNTTEAILKGLRYGEIKPTVEPEASIKHKPIAPIKEPIQYKKFYY